MTQLPLHHLETVILVFDAAMEYIYYQASWQSCGFKNTMHASFVVSRIGRLHVTSLNFDATELQIFQGNLGAQ